MNEEMRSRIKFTCHQSNLMMCGVVNDINIRSHVTPVEHQLKKGLKNSKNSGPNGTRTQTSTMPAGLFHGWRVAIRF